MSAGQPPPTPWTAPLHAVAVDRRYVDAPAFQAGARRSVLLRSRRGEEVSAPCDGVVTFRGSVAGSPPTLTLACGELRATLRWVDSTLSRGRAVGRGEHVGVAAATQLGLSARRAGGAYVDPLTLLGAAGEHRVPPGGVPAPRGSGRRESPGTRRVATAPVLRPVHLPARAFVPGAGSGDVAASGARPGRRHIADAATTSATTTTAVRATEPVDWPLTVAGVLAVLGSTAGSLLVALRRRRRSGPSGVRGSGLAHLVGERR